MNTNYSSIVFLSLSVCVCVTNIDILLIAFGKTWSSIKARRASGFLKWAV